MTETFSEGNVDTGTQTGPQQVDNFSKELSDFLLNEKLTNKEEISNLLISNSDLKSGFEEFLKTANLRQKIKCKKELQNCNTAEEIKSIIVENLPEGYKLGSIEVGNNTERRETIVEDENFINLKEQAKTDTEQAKTDTEQAKTDTEQAKTDTEQAENQKELGESIKAMKQAIEERDRLTAKYENLDSLTNINTQNYQNVKNQLEQSGTLNQLRQNHDEQFVNDYILVQATLAELKSNPTLYEHNDISTFDKIVKDLNNKCNIPDTKLSSFDKDNIAQTRTELFNEDIGNDSLISAKKSNMKSRDYSEVFHEMNDEELISEYGHLLEGNSKEFWQQYQTSPELKNQINALKNNQNLTDEEKQLLLNYNNMVSELKNIKENTENETKNLMEELCLISQVKGLSMCIGQERGNDFNFNKANEIQNDNGVLTLNGHIDGVDFSVRHDTNKLGARLQTNSKLGVSADRNTFTLGSGKQFVDSPFILPSQNEIFKVITQEVQSDSNDLKKSDSLASYFENLQQNIMGRMDNVYKDAELAHHYITNKVKGEKIVDNSISLIQGIKSDIDFSKTINQANNPKLHSFLKIINFNVENSTTGEKDKLNKVLNRIEEIKNNYRHNNGNETVDTTKYPPIIENYLKNETRLQNGNEDPKFGMISDLFTYYSENSRDQRSSLEGTEGTASKMVITDMYRDLFEFNTNGTSLTAQNWEGTRTNKTADSYLDAALEGFPPSTGNPNLEAISMA